MPVDLPKTYKVAVYKEANKPLVFEERELKLPEDGQVRSLMIILLAHSDLFVRFSSKF